MRKPHSSWPRLCEEIVLLWLINLGLWLCFTVKLAADELVVGAVAAVVGTIGWIIFQRAAAVTFRPSLSDVLQLWRIPWYMIAGAVEIMQGLAQQLFSSQPAPSLVRRVGFNLSGDEVRANARTVLAVTYTTATPNFIVLGVLQREQQMIYHQILPGDVMQMTLNLGAKA